LKGAELDGPEIFTFAESARPTTSLVFEAGAQGLIAMWGEEGDHEAFTPAQSGYDRLVVLHRTLDGDALTEPMVIDVPELGYYRPARPIAELGYPRGYLLSWAAQAGAADGIFALRLDCAGP
jgi:hypothetical protein